MLGHTKNTQPKSLTYHLDAVSIDRLSEWIEEALSGRKIEHKEVLRLRLSAEEVLGIWADTLGEDAECICETAGSPGRRMVILRCPGEMINPTDEMTISSFISDSPNIISALGMTTEYSYHGGCNILKIAQPQKPKKVSSLPIAVVSALVLGLGLRIGLPTVGDALDSALIDPIFNTLLRLLSAISGPLIFLSLASGIIGIGSPKVLGRIGKKLLSLFGIGYLILAGLSVAAGITVYTVSYGGAASAGNSAGQIRDLFLNIIPSNIIDPFQSGNAMQIIFMAICVGIAVLALGGNVSVLSDMLCQMNIVVQLIMSSIGKLMPLFIFVSLMNLIHDGNVAYIVHLLRPLLLVTGVLLIWLILNIAFVSVKKRIPFMEFTKAALPSFIIGLTTASSAAAFQTNVDLCRDKLHMEEHAINLGISLGQVLYMPGVACAYLFMVFGVAGLHHVTITPVWIVTAAIVSILIAAASPPIPGGGLTAAAILFAQLGIPESALSMSVSYLLITDYISTAVNLVSLLVVLYLASERES